MFTVKLARLGAPQNFFEPFPNFLDGGSLSPLVLPRRRFCRIYETKRRGAGGEGIGATVRTVSTALKLDKIEQSSLLTHPTHASYIFGKQIIFFGKSLDLKIQFRFLEKNQISKNKGWGISRVSTRTQWGYL